MPTARHAGVLNSAGSSFAVRGRRVRCRVAACRWRAARRRSVRHRDLDHGRPQQLAVNHEALHMWRVAGWRCGWGGGEPRGTEAQGWPSRRPPAPACKHAAAGRVPPLHTHLAELLQHGAVLHVVVLFPHDGVVQGGVKGGAHACGRQEVGHRPRSASDQRRQHLAGRAIQPQAATLSAPNHSGSTLQPPAAGPRPLAPRRTRRGLQAHAPE